MKLVNRPTDQPTDRRRQTDIRDHREDSLPIMFFISIGNQKKIKKTKYCKNNNGHKDRNTNGKM